MTKRDIGGLLAAVGFAVLCLLFAYGKVWPASVTWNYGEGLPFTVDTVRITFYADYDSTSTIDSTDTDSIQFSFSIQDTVCNEFKVRYYKSGHWWSWCDYYGSWYTHGDSTAWHHRHFFGSDPPDTVIRFIWFSYGVGVDTLTSLDSLIDSTLLIDSELVEIFYELRYTGEPLRLGFFDRHDPSGYGAAGADTVYADTINVIASGSSDLCTVFLVYYKEGLPVRGGLLTVRNENTGTDTTQDVILGPVAKYAFTDVNGIAQYPTGIHVPRSVLWHDSTKALYDISFTVQGRIVAAWYDQWIPDQDTFRLTID